MYFFVPRNWYWTLILPVAEETLENTVFIILQKGLLRWMLLCEGVTFISQACAVLVQAQIRRWRLLFQGFIVVYCCNFFSVFLSCSYFSPVFFVQKELWGSLFLPLKKTHCRLELLFWLIQNLGLGSWRKSSIYGLWSFIFLLILIFEVFIFIFYFYCFIAKEISSEELNLGISLLLEPSVFHCYLKQLRGGLEKFR